MKKLLMMWMTSVIVLFVLVSCEESKEVTNTTKTEGAGGRCRRSEKRHKRPCNNKGRSK